MFDDEIHRAAFSTPPEIAELERPFWDLFAFLGDRWQPQSDLLPWWANESITVAFFRPVTGFTHWLDYQLWPTRAMAMHLQNLLWFAAVVWIATRLYRALPGWRHTWIAGLAALLFALDDAHGPPAVWIANRNALLGFFFGACALWIHHRARLRQRTWGSPLTPLFVLLALLSAEAAIAWGAYLASYALLLDRGELRSRIGSLLPTAATGITWFAVHRVLGYGLRDQRLHHAWSPSAAGSTRGARVHRWVLRLLTLPLLLVHLVQAPIGLAAAAHFHGLARDLFGGYSESFPSDPHVTRQDVVIVQALSFFTVAYGPTHQALRGQPIPRTTSVLASGLETVEVFRPDESSLVLRPANGFFAPSGTAPPGEIPAAFDMNYGFQLFDTGFSDGRPFAVGEERSHGPFELEVLELTEDHRPAEVRFRFQTPLEDPSLVWLGWGPKGFVPWEPPGVGERLTLPAARF